jgi:hypothetical protein
MADPESPARTRQPASHRLDPCIEAAIERWIVRSAACTHLEPGDARALLTSIRREARDVLQRASPAADTSPEALDGHADAVVAASVARVIARERPTDRPAARA